MLSVQLEVEQNLAKQNAIAMPFPAGHYYSSSMNLELRAAVLSGTPHDISIRDGLIESIRPHSPGSVASPDKRNSRSEPPSEGCEIDEG